MQAIQNNNYSLVAKFIEEKELLPYREADGEKITGFGYACIHGYLEIVQLFMEKMQYNDIEDIKYGMVRAAMSNKPQILHYLLESRQLFIKESYSTDERDTLYRIVLHKPLCLTALLEGEFYPEVSYLSEVFFKNSPSFGIILEYATIEEISSFMDKLVKQDTVLVETANLFIFVNYLLNLPETEVDQLMQQCASWHNDNSFQKKNIEPFEHPLKRAKLHYNLEKDLVQKSKYKANPKI